MSVIKPSLLAYFGLVSHFCRDTSTSLHALWILRQNDQEYKANLRQSKTIPKYRIKCKQNLIRLESRHLQGYFFLGVSIRLEPGQNLCLSSFRLCEESSFMQLQSPVAWMSWWVVPSLHRQTYQQWLDTALCSRMLIFLAAISLF